MADAGPLKPAARRPSALVLVVGPAWVGDMVMAQPLYAALARSAADQPATTAVWGAGTDPPTAGATASPTPAAVDVVGPAFAAPLIERMPGVRRAWTLAVAHGELGLKRRRRLAQALADTGYERALVLPKAWKAALVPWLAGVPVRSGYRGEWRYGLLNDVRDPRPLRHARTADRFRALAGDAVRTAEPPSLRVDAAQRRALVARLGLDAERPVLALCPGAAFGAAKRWPPRHYATLAARWLAAGWQVWLLGSGGDGAATASIRAQLTPDARARCADLAGGTDLGEVVDLMSLAAAVVANDSGLLHVAGAVGRPVVAVYGSTSPEVTPPLGSRARALGLALPCRPCFQRACPLGHRRCLENLEPERVENALAELGVRRD